MFIDPYAANPLAREMQVRDPARYAQVSAVKEPPKMFAGGTADVPAFTASGIEPTLLLKLPYGIRHAAAVNPDIIQVYRWFEDYAGFPEAEIDTDGLRDAKLRMESWLTETDPRTPAEIAAQDHADKAMLEAYLRSQDRDGLLPEEREAKRREDWDAKQSALAEARRTGAIR